MSDVNLSISQEVVRPIIEAKIQAAIAAELGGVQPIIARIVESVLSASTDSEGKPDRYGGRRTFIQWLCEDAIRQSVDKAVRTKIAALAVEIEKSVSAELGRHRNDIAHQLVSGFVEASKSHWQMRTSFSLEVAKPDR